MLIIDIDVQVEEVDKYYSQAQVETDRTCKQDLYLWVGGWNAKE